MFIPSRFKTTTPITTTGADTAPAVVTSREPNTRYQASSEGRVAIFLGRNMIKDMFRRNYAVAPGGDVVYFSDLKPLNVGISAPTAQESFGHNSEVKHEGRW